MLVKTYFIRRVEKLSLVFSALISMPQALEALSRHSTNFSGSSSAPAKTIDVISNAEMGNCSASNADSAFVIFQASVMMLSRNMLKRVGESRHPRRTRNVFFRSQSPMLPLKRTALVVLSQRCLMTRIRLALMMYFFMVAHKVACQTQTKKKTLCGIYKTFFS